MSLSRLFAARRRWVWLASLGLAGALGLLGVGCSGSNPLGSAGGDGSGASGVARSVTLPDTRLQRPKLPAGAACGWTIASNEDLVNVAFPDDSAKYWALVLPRIPGTRLRIDGRFGQMRYLSFNVYDPLLRSIGALADVELVPNNGLRNPFVDAAAPLGGGYTVYVEFTARPENPAPNTLYAGAIPTGDGGAVPNLLGTGVMYRSYVPAPGVAFDGGVGLPVLTLETADGAQEILPFADCEEPLLPTAGGLITALGANELLKNTNPLQGLLGLANFPTAELPPKSRVFYGLPVVGQQILGNLLGLPLGDGEPGSLPLTGGGGFLDNAHNKYIATPFSRAFGSVFVLRARAPSWRGAPGVEWGREQLRYWSICQNEFATQRFVDCLRDEETVLDRERFVTVMVSDPANRPEWATAENGINWLPWGPYPDGLIIFRNMLPNAGFAQAVQNVPQGTPPGEVMGDYEPLGAYCDTAQLSSPPRSPAELFAACREATLARGPQTGLLPSVLPGGVLGGAGRP